MSETSSVKSQLSGNSAGKTSWPADKVERWPIERLIPYARNARTHSDAKSTRSRHRSGNGAGPIRCWSPRTARSSPAMAGCWPPGSSASPKSRSWWRPAGRKAQMHAYALADNKLALNAGWDEELLGLELGELEELGFDLDLIGFTEAERAALAAHGTEGLTDPDEVPELPEQPGLAPGRCLAARPPSAAVRRQHVAPTDVSRVLGGVKPHLMVTDPPYGVDYDPAWRTAAGVNLNKRKLGKVANDDRADWREAWALFPGSVAYVWHAGRYASTVQEFAGGRRLRGARADHLGQGPLCAQPRPLSLAA